MNYETAKKLKEAGFPQEDLENGICLDDDMTELMSKETHSRIPTLSELISECNKFGEAVLTLVDANGTYKVGVMDRDLNAQKIYFGESYEEAVANLWLALQENGKK